MGQLKKLRKDNISRILRAIYENGPSSKKQIAGFTGCSTTLLTKICNQLKEDGILEEGEALKSHKAGRREVLININYKNKMIVGVDFYSDITSIIITDLKPEVLFKKVLNTPVENIEEFLEQIIGVIRKYMLENNLAEEDFLGLGVGVKGGISIDTGVLSSELWGRSINLKDFFENEIKIPLFYENETNNLAIAEHFSRKDLSDFFMIRYGLDGIGGAIIKDNKLLLNNTNTTGKIGHMIVDSSYEYCPICKRKGCLESIISLRRILSEVNALYINNKLPVLQKLCNNSVSNITYDKIFEAYNAGSIELNNIIRKSASYMAQAIISTYSLLGIKDFVLHGYFFDYPEYIELLKHSLVELQLGADVPRLLISNISTHETNISSALLVLNQTLYSME